MSSVTQKRDHNAQWAIQTQQFCNYLNNLHVVLRRKFIYRQGNRVFLETRSAWGVNNYRDGRPI